MPFQGMGFETGLGHGIGNGSTLRQNGIEADKNSFGEAFGAATGVSEPRLQKRRRNLSPSSLLSGPIHPEPAAKLLAGLHGL